MDEQSRQHVEGFSPSQGRQMDRLCDRFEAAWQGVAQGNPRPRLEDFLGEGEGPACEELLRELIALEVYYLQQHGECPSPEQYQARFPSLGAEVLAEAFASVVASQPPAGPNAVTPTVGASEVPTQVIPPGECIGEYELLAEIARGGMGVVYRARDRRLDRVVALKMILAGQFASEAELQRFRSEAESAAHLDHPHIVPLYDVGEHQGLPFFCMKFIEGGSLNQHKQRLAEDPTEVARLLRCVAEAVHHAHQRGILHRDLKPANILLDEQGQPHVTDFGLAKRVEAGAGLTQSGAIVGTPGYLAPEQARGQTHQVTTAADVWGLGAILYEMLTGQPPFRASTPLDTVLLVLQSEPVPPSRLRPGIPRDLETICLTCLHKDPHKRYPSAEALAEDVRRWQNDEPIQARPAGRTERLLKWVKRRPALAGLMLTGVLLFLLVGFGGPLLAWHQANLRRTAEDEKTRAEVANRLADERARAEETAKKRAEKELYRAERQIYLGNLREAQLALNAGDYGTAADRLDACRWDYRGWEHNHLFTRLHQDQVTLRGHTSELYCVAFSPDGRRFASAGKDLMVKIWDSHTGTELHSLRGHTDSIRSVAFSPDGKRLVSGGDDKMVKVWNPITGKEVLTFQGHPRAINGVAFASDGRRIVVSGDSADFLKVWDIQRRQPLLTFSTHAWKVQGVSFTLDGQRIVSALHDNVLKIWDASTGGHLLTLRGHKGRVLSVAVSPDGKRIVSGSADKTVRIWDANSGQELRILHGHQAWVNSVTFSADSRWVVSGSADKTVRIWDANSGQELRTLQGHQARVHSVSFSPDGRRIVSASGDKTVKLWNLDSSRETKTVRSRRSEGQLLCVSSSPDGKQIACGTSERFIHVWDVKTGNEVHTIRGPGCNYTEKYTSVDYGWVFSVAFSPNSKRLVTGSQDKTVHVLDANTGQEVLALRGHTGPVWSVCFSSDGQRVVSGSSDKTVRVWDATTGEGNLTLKGHTDAVRSVAFSPDGKWIVSGSDDKTGKVWNAITGREVLTLKGLIGSEPRVAFGPNSQRIVSGSKEQTVKVWDAHSGEELLTLRGHASAVKSVLFSSDGRRIFSGSIDGALLVWDVATGEKLLTIRGHGACVSGLSMSVDGLRLCSSSWDGTVKIWDADLRQEVMTLRGDTEQLRGVVFGPEGKTIVAQNPEEKVFVWDSSTGQLLTDTQWQEPIPRQREALSPNKKRLARIEGGTIVVRPHGRLTALEQLNRQRLARWAKPDSAWHQQQAKEARLARQDFAEAFHLTRATKDRAEAIALHEGALAKQPGQKEVAMALARLLAETGSTDWKVLKPTAVKSAEGATMTILQDDSVLVSGPCPNNDSYTLSAPLQGKQIAALRLETLAHPSLPAGGPGRAGNGNFWLTEFRVRHLALVGRVTPQRMATALANYTYSGKNATEHDGPRGAIDSRQDTRWDIHPREGQDHWIAFQLASPCAVNAGDKIVVELDFQTQRYKRHTLGHFRLSVTDRAHALLAEQLRLAVFRKKLHGFVALAAAYFAQGKWDRVHKILTDRMAKDPKASPTETLLLALTCQQLGKPEQARQAYERALRSLERHPQDETVRVLARQAMTTVGGLTAAKAETRLARLKEKQQYHLPGTVVVLASPGTGQRKASAEEIASWIRQLNHSDSSKREAAAQGLEQAGSQALKQLTEASKKGNTSSAAQIHHLIDRIRLRQTLGGRRLHLHLTEAQPADALKALSQQAGVAIRYAPGTTTNPKAPQKLTMKQDNVTFWQALDHICQKAGLTYRIYSSSRGQYVRVYPTSVASPSHVAYAGVFRLHAGSTYLSRNVPLRTDTRAGTSSMSMSVSLMHASSLPIAVGSPSIQEATDEKGQALTLVGGTASRSLTQTSLLSSRKVSLRLPASFQNVRKLQHLKLTLPIEVGVPAGESLKITHLAHTRGKTFANANGSVDMLQVTRRGSYFALMLGLAGPQGTFNPETHSFAFQLLDQNGKPYRLVSTPRFFRRSLRRPHPAQLGVVALTPAIPPGHVPWGSLLMLGKQASYTRQVTGLRFDAPTAGSQPTTLTVTRLKKVRTSVSFEFRDVPLP